MTRFPMTTPIVEMDGDEMTRVLWRKIKDVLLLPFLELNTEVYDLGLPNREKTGDAVTIAAAQAVRRLGVGVKCATITPNAARVEEYKLSRAWPSPNGTIRSMLDGTTFRSPILVKNIKPHVPAWTKPITLARHSYGDIYKDAELRLTGPCTVTLSSSDGQAKTVFSYDGPGVALAMYNTDKSIESFARSCFACALEKKQDLWFSCKDTISKTYDGRFRDIFEALYESEYKAAFEEAGLSYFYTLIDDAVARLMRSSGGMVWALKNYDGDVMSDMVSSAFGSLAMMTSVLVSPDGCFVYEAAHGTVTRHYTRHLAGEKTSTNPVATIFAWTGALRKRGELDASVPLCAFADKLERACLDTIEAGQVTQDLAPLCGAPASLDTDGFLTAVALRLIAAL